MQKEKCNKNFKSGFTLLELLVVVIIIGILAAIALPQYKMAVTKAKVVKMLPLMRKFSDALQEWNLQHGHYCANSSCVDRASPSDVDVFCPNNWYKSGSTRQCKEYYACNDGDSITCIMNNMKSGTVECNFGKKRSDGLFSVNFAITIYPLDHPYEELRGIRCVAYGSNNIGHKACKSLSGKQNGTEVSDGVYLYRL